MMQVTFDMVLLELKHDLDPAPMFLEAISWLCLPTLVLVLPLSHRVRNEMYY